MITLRTVVTRSVTHALTWLVAIALIAGCVPLPQPATTPPLTAAVTARPAPASGMVLEIDEGGGPVRVTFADAPELPAQRNNAGGLFLRRQDNNLILGTGRITVEAEVINGEATLSATNDGPEVEVVVTADTVIYEDITERPVIGPEDVEKGEIVVQRKVRQVPDIAAIESKMLVRVWGEQRGDRVIAEILVYNRLGQM